MGYPNIRISAFEIFGFFRIFGSCSYNFQAIMLKLGVNDHHMSVDVLGYPVSHVYQIAPRAQRATYIK